MQPIFHFQLWIVHAIISMGVGGSRVLVVVVAKYRHRHGILRHTMPLLLSDTLQVKQAFRTSFSCVVLKCLFVWFRYGSGWNNTQKRVIKYYGEKEGLKFSFTETKPRQRSFPPRVNVLFKVRPWNRHPQYKLHNFVCNALTCIQDFGDIHPFPKKPTQHTS